MYNYLVINRTFFLLFQSGYKKIREIRSAVLQVSSISHHCIIDLSNCYFNDK